MHSPKLSAKQRVLFFLFPCDLVGVRQRNGVNGLYAVMYTASRAEPRAPEYSPSLRATRLDARTGPRSQLHRGCRSRRTHRRRRGSWSASNVFLCLRQLRTSRGCVALRQSGVLFVVWWTALLICTLLCDNFRAAFLHAPSISYAFLYFVKMTFAPVSEFRQQLLTLGWLRTKVL